MLPLRWQVGATYTTIRLPSPRGNWKGRTDKPYVSIQSAKTELYIFDFDLRTRTLQSAATEDLMIAEDFRVRRDATSIDIATTNSGKLSNVLTYRQLGLNLYIVRTCDVSSWYTSSLRMVAPSELRKHLLCCPIYKSAKCSGGHGPRGDLVSTLAWGSLDVLQVHIFEID